MRKCKMSKNVPVGVGMESYHEGSHEIMYFPVVYFLVLRTDRQVLYVLLGEILQPILIYYILALKTNDLYKIRIRTYLQKRLKSIIYCFI